MGEARKELVREAAPPTRFRARARACNAILLPHQPVCKYSIVFLCWRGMVRFSLAQEREKGAGKRRGRFAA